jgi:hypothetical protein
MSAWSDQPTFSWNAANVRSSPFLPGERGDVTGQKLPLEMIAEKGTFELEGDLVLIKYLGCGIFAAAALCSCPCVPRRVTQLLTLTKASFERASDSA